MTAFHEWLTEIDAAPLTVDASPGGIRDEARSNQWSFSFTQEQGQSLAQEDVTAFLDAVVELYNKRLAQAEYANYMMFYSWFDSQASQLRFSLVSASHGFLPFACSIEIVSSSAKIVELLLDSSYLDGIPLGEFVEHDDMKPHKAGDVPLPVWLKELPVYLSRPFGLAEGEFIVPDDFDAPLPEEILREFEGRGRS